MSIKIEAGKYYRTRDGKKIGPMQFCAGTVYRWYWMSYLYTDDGECIKGCNNPFDLIAEWTEPSASIFDISKIEVGDSIHLLFKVTGRTYNGSPLVDYGLCSYAPPLESITAHIPAPRTIKIGDVVEIKRVHDLFMVIGLSGDEAWLQSQLTSKRTTRIISELTRVDSPSAESAQ